MGGTVTVTNKNANRGYGGLVMDGGTTVVATTNHGYMKVSGFDYSIYRTGGNSGFYGFATYNAETSCGGFNDCPVHGLNISENNNMHGDWGMDGAIYNALASETYWQAIVGANHNPYHSAGALSQDKVSASVNWANVTIMK